MALALVAVLGASLIVNFLLYQQNGYLVAALDRAARDNERLAGELAGAADGPRGQAGGPGGGEPGAGPGAGYGGPPDGGQSINSVGVRPLVVRDGFFERTQYEGTVMKILVSVRDPGEGLVLVNTEVPTGIDFQESARVAAKVAQDYLGEDLSGRDVVFSITVDADKTRLQTVDGRSAGAAMAVLLISELQGRGISGDMVITGSILPDARIGAVGGISDKARAAGAHGASVFLVPSGQNVAQVESCEESRAGNFVYRSCALEQKPLSPMTEEAYGMEVLEVADVGDALGHFQAAAAPGGGS